MTDQKIYEFVKESNAIENIFREPTQKEIDEFRRFLDLEVVTIDELEKFVKVYQPTAKLRDTYGMDVQVNGYIAPGGGPTIINRLTKLLSKKIGPYDLHIAYELIHPFTDGNGRSGRALWAWRMQEWHGSFLQNFYYQTLASRS